MQERESLSYDARPEFTLAAEGLPDMSPFGSRTNDHCWRFVASPPRKRIRDVTEAPLGGRPSGSKKNRADFQAGVEPLLGGLDTECRFFQIVGLEVAAPGGAADADQGAPYSAVQRCSTSAKHISKAIASGVSGLGR